MPETVSERPTFAQAFAASEPAAEPLPATPSSETPPAASASAATTEPPAPAESTDVTPVAPAGEPPPERWPDILDNARTKARDEAIAELKQQYAWAESIDRAAYEQGARIGSLYNTDRQGFLRQVMAEALGDPVLAPLARSEAARALASRQPAAPEPELEPDIPVVDDQGRVVSQAFSADRVKQYVQRAVAEALTREVGPLKQTVQSVEHERQALAMRQDAEHAATTEYQRAQAWPGFTEHEKAIGDAFAQHPEWSLQDAYIAVAVPKLQAATQAKQLESLQTKAAAAVGSVNPAAAVVTSHARPQSFHDSRLTW